jgi:capsular polysaccharide biosynthesis protein
LSRRNVDLDAEQEVDLGRYWSAIVARWWLPVLGLVAGAFVGYLISLGGKEVWKASATVYLGASYSSVGGVFLQGPQANPSTAGTIARAESSIDAAAVQAGMRAGDLRGHVSTQTISTGSGSSVVRTTGNPLVRVTVQASTRRRAQRAANALAKIVVDRLSPYADRKIDTLEQRIASDQAQVDAIRRGSSASDALGKAVLAVQIGDVLDDQLQAKQLLIQAQEIERPKVLTRAAAAKTTARSRRNSVVVAAFLGVVLGLLAALVWEPLTRRRSP